MLHCFHNNQRFSGERACVAKVIATSTKFILCIGAYSPCRVGVFSFFDRDLGRRENRGGYPTGNAIRRAECESDWDSSRSLPRETHGTDAVSYTHLDVYKRQRETCSSEYRKRALRCQEKLITPQKKPRWTSRLFFFS